MHNRKTRRGQASKTRRAVKGIAKASGQAEPTAEEKDPAFLALQVRSLIGQVEALAQVQRENTAEIHNAFAMNDVHIHVFRRITRDLTDSVVAVRRLQCDGEVTFSLGDFRVKLQENGELDLHGYYDTFKEVAQAAGEAAADVAVSHWAQGLTPEEAVARATLEVSKPETAQDAEGDSDYEVQFFGGNSGQSSHEQVSANPQEGG